jgi:cysteine desulfuration protein SufE
MSTDQLPPRLGEIVDDFALMEGEEKLEYLLEMARRLPPLPGRLVAQKDRMDVVHECQTPVFVHAEKRADGRYTFFLDVSPEAPTVRGFAAILQIGLNDVTLEQLMAVPTEFYLQMGLQSVLSGQRLNGIAAILAHMKRVAQQV